MYRRLMILVLIMSLAFVPAFVLAQGDPVGGDDDDDSGDDEPIDDKQFLGQIQFQGQMQGQGMSNNINHPRPFINAPRHLGNGMSISVPSNSKFWNTGWQHVPRSYVMGSVNYRRMGRGKLQRKEWLPYGKKNLYRSSRPAKVHLYFSAKELGKLNYEVIATLGLAGTRRASPEYIAGRAMQEAGLRGGNAVMVYHYGHGVHNFAVSRVRKFSFLGIPLPLPVSFGRTNAKGFGAATTFGPTGRYAVSRQNAEPFLRALILRVADSQDVYRNARHKVWHKALRNIAEKRANRVCQPASVRKSAGKRSRKVEHEEEPDSAAFTGSLDEEPHPWWYYVVIPLALVVCGTFLGRWTTPRTIN